MVSGNAGIMYNGIKTGPTAAQDQNKKYPCFRVFIRPSSNPPTLSLKKKSLLTHCFLHKIRHLISSKQQGTMLIYKLRHEWLSRFLINTSYTKIQKKSKGVFEVVLSSLSGNLQRDLIYLNWEQGYFYLA